MIVNQAGSLSNTSQGGLFELGGILNIKGDLGLNNAESLTILETGHLIINGKMGISMASDFVNNGRITNSGEIKVDPRNGCALVNNGVYEGNGKIEGPMPALLSQKSRIPVTVFENPDHAGNSLPIGRARDSYMPESPMQSANSAKVANGYRQILKTKSGIIKSDDAAFSTFKIKNVFHYYISSPIDALAIKLGI